MQEMRVYGACIVFGKALTSPRGVKVLLEPKFDQRRNANYKRKVKKALESHPAQILTSDERGIVDDKINGDYEKWSVGYAIPKSN